MVLEVSEDLMSVDEEVTLDAAGVAFALLDLDALAPILGVGVGEVGGFKSSYLQEDGDKLGLVLSGSTYNAININRTHAIYGESGVIEVAFISLGFSSAKVLGIPEVILSGTSGWGPSASADS